MSASYLLVLNILVLVTYRRREKLAGEPISGPFINKELRSKGVYYYASDRGTRLQESTAYSEA